MLENEDAVLPQDGRLQVRRDVTTSSGRDIRNFVGATFVTDADAWTILVCYVIGPFVRHGLRSCVSSSKPERVGSMEVTPPGNGADSVGKKADTFGRFAGTGFRRRERVLPEMAPVGTVAERVHTSAGYDDSKRYHDRHRDQESSSSTQDTLAVTGL